MNESKWRPMEEAPRDGTEVYLSDEKSCQSGFFCLHGKGWFSNDGDDLFFKPACWHELPKPPIKKHCCKKELFSVESSGSGLFLCFRGQKEMAVDFCPFCGEKA